MNLSIVSILLLLTLNVTIGVVVEVKVEKNLIMLDDTVDIICKTKLNGIKPFELKWYKGSEQIFVQNFFSGITTMESSNGTRISHTLKSGYFSNCTDLDGNEGKGQIESKLSLHNVAIQDQGVYRCEIQVFQLLKKSSSASANIQIHPVTENPPNMTEVLGSYKVGDLILANCNFEFSNPKLAVRFDWEINGRLINESSSDLFIGEISKSIFRSDFIYKVNKTDFDDEGKLNLTCIAVLNENKKLSTSKLLHLKQDINTISAVSENPPNMTKMLGTYKVGDSMLANCNFEFSNPKLTVRFYWQINGRLINDSSSDSFIGEISKSILRSYFIYKVKKTDFDYRGWLNLTCIAALNENKKLSTSKILHLKQDISTIQVSLERGEMKIITDNENPVLGDDMTLSCLYKHSRDIYYIKWFIDDKEFVRCITDTYIPLRFYEIDGLQVDETAAIDYHRHECIVPSFEKDGVIRSEIKLENLQKSNSGVYRCEIATDEPTFYIRSSERQIQIQ